MQNREKPAKNSPFAFSQLTLPANTEAMYEAIGGVMYGKDDQVYRLTSKQLAEVPKYKQWWTKIVNSTAPIDMATVKPAIENVYEICELKKPTVIYLQSPREFEELCKSRVVNETSSVYLTLKQNLVKAFYKGVGVLRTSLSPTQRPLLDEIRSFSMPTELRRYYQRSGLRADSFIWDAETDSRYTFRFSAAQMEYFRDMFGMIIPGLSDLIEISRNSSAVGFYKDVAVVIDRPREINVENGELHREDGPSIRYADNSCMWHINGIQVPPIVVMSPEIQTIQDILSEQNMEVQRIRIERWGWDRYLAEMDAVVIDKRTNDVEGTVESLFRVRVFSTNRLLRSVQEQVHVFVGACPSTGRVYSMEVPSNLSTCREAQKWLTGGQNLNMIGGS